MPDTYRCDWPLTHEPHEWEYRQQTVACDGEPLPPEQPITRTDDPAEQLRTAARLPGVHSAVVYPDGVEFCGSPSDRDDRAAFIAGRFRLTQVQRIVCPLPVEQGDPS